MDLTNLTIKIERDGQFTAVKVHTANGCPYVAVDTMLLAILQLCVASRLTPDEAIEKVTKRLKEMAGSLTIDPAMADA